MCQTTTEVCARVLFLLVFNWIMTNHSYSCILHEIVQQLICDPEKLGLLISRVVNCIVSGRDTHFCKLQAWIYGLEQQRIICRFTFEIIHGYTAAGHSIDPEKSFETFDDCYISWFLSSLAFFEYKIFLLQSLLMKNVLNSTKKQFSLSHIKGKYRSVEFYLRKHSSLQVHWI